MAAADVLTVAAGLLFVITPLHGQTQSIKSEVRTIVKSVRDVITRAKEGSPLENIFQDLDYLQNATVSLTSRLPTNEISECEIQTVIKLAAAGVGIHEVIGALLAEGEMEILSRRIGLALSFDDQAAQLLEDKVSRSSDVGPELYAMIFGINTTANIIKTADATIKEKLTLVEQGNRSKRDVARHLARGFDVNNHVAWWRDTIGWHTFHVGPLGPPLFPHGLRHVQRRSPQWMGGLSGSGGSSSGSLNGNLGWKNPNGGLSAGVGAGAAWGPGGVQKSVNGNLGWTNPNGGLSAGVGAGVAWGPGGVQPSVNGNLGWTSQDGRFSAGVNGGVTWGQGGPIPNLGVTFGLKF